MLDVFLSRWQICVYFNHKISIPNSCLTFLQEIIVPDDAEECVLVDFDPASHPRHHNGRGTEIYDSDDEGGQQGQGVQCASQ